MLADTQIFFLWTLTSVSVYWIAPPSNSIFRQYWLILTSVVFVFALAPVAALLVLWMTVVCCFSGVLSREGNHLLLLWFCITLACIPLLALRTLYSDVTLLTSLGITFATLRAVSVILDNYSKAYIPDKATIFLYMFFLPLYTVGPVDKARAFSYTELERNFCINDFLRGISRCCLGLFKSVYLADQLIKTRLTDRFPADSLEFYNFDSGDALIFITLSFLYTYVNFSAFVDIAIGVSKMLRINIIENFNFPLFSKNLQDFWKRWHISLGNWISNYLYLPFVFSIGKSYAPYLATFISFSLIGWWHESSYNYIIWGVLHGIGLCIVQFWIKFTKKHKLTAITKNKAYKIISWASTLFFVAWVQTIANQGSLENALLITKALIKI